MTAPACGSSEAPATGALRFDANMLRNSAAIIRRHAAKPRSFWVGVLCRVLEEFAAKLDRKANSL